MDARPPAAAPMTLRRSRNPMLAAFDAGGSVFQRRTRDILLGAALLLAPVVALNVWTTVVAFDRLDSDAGIFGTGRGAGIEDVAVFSAAVLAGIAAAVVGHFAAVLVMGERFGPPVSMGRALALTVRRLPTIVFAWVLTHWWFVLMALIVVTSASDVVGVWLFLFGAMSWFFSTATLLVIPVMVGEGLGPFASGRRGWRLVRLRLGLCLSFVFVSAVLGALLITGLATLVPLLVQFGFLELGGAEPIVQGVMTQVAVLFVVPLIALATAHLYVEVRLEGEALDISMEADAAFGPRLGAIGAGSSARSDVRIGGRDR